MIIALRGVMVHSPQLFIDGVRDYPLDDHALVGTIKVFELSQVIKPGTLKKGILNPLRISVEKLTEALKK